MPLQAVIFDMDGVIIDSHAVSTQLVVECAAKFGVTLDEEDKFAWSGLSGPQFWGGVHRRYGLTVPLETVLNAYDVDEEIRRYAALSPIAGVVELMHDLRREGIPLALATSGSQRRLGIVLELFQLAPMFTVTLGRQDVTRCKPDPEVYRLAAERLGVAPQHCVAIEDSFHGLSAASGAGMKCVAYLPGGPLRESVPGVALSVSSLTELNAARLNRLVS